MRCCRAATYGPLGKAPNPLCFFAAGVHSTASRAAEGERMQAILAFSLLMPSFLLQQLPEQPAIMKQQAAAAQKYRTLQYVRDSSTEMLSGPFAGTKTTAEVSMYIKNPGKSRIETRTQGQPAMVIVSDGDFIWTYNQSAKRYTKTAAAMGMPGVLAGINSIDIQSVLSGAKTSQRTIREDSVE